jgi:hypothetical protein
MMFLSGDVENNDVGGFKFIMLGQHYNKANNV